MARRSLSSRKSAELPAPTPAKKQPAPPSNEAPPDAPGKPAGLPKQFEKDLPAPKYQNYGPNKRMLGVNEEAGTRLPTGIDYLAGGLPTYTQVGVPLTPIDYMRIEQRFPTAHAVENKGTDLAALDVRVWGKSAEAAGGSGQAAVNDKGEEEDGSDDAGTQGPDNPGAGNPYGAIVRPRGGQPPAVREAAFPPARDSGVDMPNAETDSGVPADMAASLKPKASPLSERAQKLQEIFDHSMGLDVFLSRAAWGYVRGIMFWQIRMFYVENVGLCFDLTEGERNHPKCGGRLRLHPDKDSIVQVRGFNSWAPANLQEEKRFDRKGWLVVKPYGGSSPDGDEAIAVQFSEEAKLDEKLQYGKNMHVDRFGVPIAVLRDLTEKQVRPSQAATKPQANADDMKRRLKPGGNVDVGLRILELSEVKGDAAKILVEFETRCEGRCERRLNGTALLSDTRATGPTGSSNQARTTKNTRGVAGARYFQDLLSAELLSYVIEQNDIWLPGNIPPLGAGELPPYVVMTEHGQREEDPTVARDPAGPAKPPDKRPLPSGDAQKDNTEVQPVK